MTRLRFTFRLVTVLACLAFGSLLTHAQNQRSWVSGVGDDANPCIRTAPCKTIQIGIIKTFQNGEVNVLDPGEYGFFATAQSITIDATGTFAGVTAPPGGVAVFINVGGGDPVRTVRLRGLSITGAGINTKAGVVGVVVGDNGLPDLKVIIEDTVIDGFTNDGIFYNNNGGELVVENSSIRNNNRAGIRADSPGANRIYVSLDHVATNLNQEGVRIEDNVRATITNSRASNNTLNGYTMFPTSLPSTMNIKNSTAANNKQYGVISISSGAATGTIRISDMEITDNVVGGLKTFTGGQICSNGRNSITAPTDPPNCPFTDQ